MNEREKILRGSVNRNIATADLPKSNLNVLIKYLTKGINSISNALHKWGQP